MPAATLFLMLAAFVQSKAQPPDSAQNSPSSATDVSRQKAVGVRQSKEPATVLSEPPAVAGGLTRRSEKPGLNENGPPVEVIINACAAAADELRASRPLIDAFGDENDLLKQRLEAEKRTSGFLAELNETRKRENEALRAAIAAKNETIMAKNAVIDKQEKLVETLKAKKQSPWKRIADVLIGAAIFAILK